MHQKRFLKMSILLISFLLLFSSCAFAISSNSSNNNASESFIQNDNEVLVFEADEITDNTQLFDKAVNGISDVAITKQPIAILSQNGTDFSNGKIKTYCTVQKLKVKKELSTGKTTTRYRKDSYALVPSSLTDVKEGYDPSTYSVLTRSTAYYDSVSCGGKTYVKYVKLGGTWTNYDPSQISWSNARVGYYQQGTQRVNSSCTTFGQGLQGNDYSVSSNPTSGQMYTATPSISYYFQNVAQLDQNNANTKITLKRIPTGTTWEFNFTNPLD